MRNSLARLCAIALVLIGGINWGIIGLFDFDAISWALQSAPDAAVRVARVAIGAAGIWLAAQNETWLPFTGQMPFPCDALSARVPLDAQIALTVQTGVPNANVVYWTDESGDTVASNPWMAYAYHNNSGITHTNEAGIAVLHVRHPGRYTSPQNHSPPNKPVVYYRVCRHPGLLSNTYTFTMS